MSDSDQSVHGQGAHPHSGAAPDLWDEDGRAQDGGAPSGADDGKDEFSSQPGPGEVVDASGNFVMDAVPVAEKPKPNILILALAGVLAVAGVAGAGYVGYNKFFNKPAAFIDEAGDLAQVTVPQVVAPAPGSVSPAAAGVFDSTGSSPGVFGSSVQAGAASVTPAAQGAPAVQVGAASVTPAAQGAPAVQVGAASVTPAAQGAPAVQVGAASVTPAAQGAPAVQVGAGKSSKGSAIIDEVEMAPVAKPSKRKVQPASKAVQPTVAQVERRKNRAQKLVAKRAALQVARAKKSDESRPLPVFLQSAKVVGVFPLSGRNAQAWVRSSEGKTIPVRKGDVINGISILEVIPEKNTVKTSAGTINAHGVVL